MKKFKLFFAVVALFFCLQAKSQTVAIKNFEEFQPLLNKSNDSIYVINFWATWCKPCVEELPFFERLHQEYQSKKVKVVLASLDFKSQYEKKLLPFVKEKNITAETFLLNAPDYNSWLPLVSKKWSGAIPATIILQHSNNTTIFFEKQLTDYKELEDYIIPLLKP